MKKPYEAFLKVDQASNERHRYACTIYSACINLYWNTGIVLSQEDIDTIVEQQIANGQLNPTKGGGLEDNFIAVFRYAQKKHPEIKYEIFNKSDKRFPDRLNLEYMLEIGIHVDKEFTYDSEDDGIINSTTDYSKLDGVIKHATNCLKWLRDGGGVNKGKHYIWDSYFGRKAFNMYEVNLRDMKDTVMMENVYMFYID